jgi:hypothetical protein
MQPGQLGFTRWANCQRIRPPTGLSSGDGVVFSSCCNGGGPGGGVGVVATLDGGGGGGQTLDPVTGDPRSTSLALDLGVRVPVGLHLVPT